MQPPSPSYAATVGHRLTTFMLLATIVVALFMVVDAVRGAPRDVTFRATAPVNLDKVPKRVHPIEKQASFSVEKPSAREQRLALAADLVPLALLAAVLWFLRGVARSVRDGDPFTSTNVRRLRVIGGLLIVGVIAAHYATAQLDLAIGDPYTSSPQQKFSEQGLLPPDDDFPFSVLLGGLGAFILAQVFAHGVRLREDVAATI